MLASSVTAGFSFIQPNSQSSAAAFINTGVKGIRWHSVKYFFQFHVFNNQTQTDKHDHFLMQVCLWIDPVVKRGLAVDLMDDLLLRCQDAQMLEAEAESRPSGRVGRRSAPGSETEKLRAEGRLASFLPGNMRRPQLPFPPPPGREEGLDGETKPTSPYSRPPPGSSPPSRRSRCRLFLHCWVEEGGGEDMICGHLSGLHSAFISEHFQAIDKNGRHACTSSRHTTMGPNCPKM